MEQIPVENIILEDEIKQEENELTPEEQAFYKEIKNMELELDKMNKQRKQYIKSIREKIRNNVKNGDDAIGHLPRYLSYTIDFEEEQFEDIDGEHTLTLLTDYGDNEGCYEIEKLAEQLCGAYLNIDIDCSDQGYIIYYSENNKENNSS
jgi:hypothetical protein